MSQQYNKVEKRRRRTAYLRRLKVKQKKANPKAGKPAAAASAS
jgi:hypothetical protein